MTTTRLKHNLDRALASLKNSDHIRLRKEGIGPSQYYIITKGLDFDKWHTKMTHPQNNNPISIGSVNASNVQVGNQNTITINVTPEELIAALSKFSENMSKEEQKSIVDKLRGHINSGIDMGETIARLIAFIG